MNARTVWAIRLGLFALCAWISQEHMDDRWVIGPVFGLVVLAWQVKWPPVLTAQHGLFLLASTLIYAVVAHIAVEAKTPFGEGDSELYLAVALGTVLLPLAHRQFLGATWERTWRTVLGVYAVWFVVVQCFSLMDVSLDWALVNTASVWQALYLYCMFGPSLPQAKYS